ILRASRSEVEWRRFQGLFPSHFEAAFNARIGPNVVFFQFSSAVLAFPAVRIFAHFPAVIAEVFVCHF
ncbi:hypothetical protein, partial [Micromonospora sp. NPDC002575]|uniref:hypothetical protein n=1 Tax=Micromonospora sp. NPDC002575 TaxID=3364222 RepID=UPI0036C3E182